MGGFFGAIAKGDVTADLFYGTDYHSHLGTQRGGMAVWGKEGFKRVIHDIRNAQFRSKFCDELHKLIGHAGIGVISDYEDQPLLISSHLGPYAIATVGAVRNLDHLVQEAFRNGAHFSEMSEGVVNPTEVVAMLINSQSGFADGLRHAQMRIEGSCSILLLTREGLYAARDRWGRTPIVIGRKADTFAVSFESCAFPNLGYEVVRDLGPGEVIRLSPDGFTIEYEPLPTTRICAFLWIYYGFPASTYEGRNVEESRNRCGENLARRDTTAVDIVCGIPDSGIGHALGYASARGLPYRRPFVKYTPTWARSFMPQDQRVRDLVAQMKLIPIRELIRGRRLLFCEDSIVRGTQLRDTIRRLYTAGAREVHMRVACPPLMHSCPYLNFSRSRSELDLAARQVAHEMEGGEPKSFEPYENPDTPEYTEMCRRVCERLGLTTLQYQRIEDMVDAIGLPRQHLCTYCMNRHG